MTPIPLRGVEDFQMGAKSSGGREAELRISKWEPRVLGDVKMKKALFSENGPPAKGPYSHAVAHGNLLFVSGQGAVDPETGNVVHGDLEAEATLTLKNLEAVLNDCGSSLDKVLKITVFLSNMDDFARFNEVYKRFFKSDCPARTCIQAGRLPFDIKVEIEAIAAL
jgi:2-iminobutanoate/2-iminopropanoate deaminase